VDSPTLAINNVGSADQAYYQLRVTDACGTAASPFTLVRLTACPTAPTISQQPVSQTIPLGSPVTFTVAASGCVAPTFQWLRRPTGAPAWTAITGATQTAYTIPNVADSDKGTYQCVVTSGGRSTASAFATLNVAPTVAFLSAYQINCTKARIYWTTSDSTTGVIQHGTRCDNLTSSTAPTALSRSGFVDVDRPASGTLYYRLVATMSGGAQATSTCRTFVFAPAIGLASPSAFGYPYYVQRFAPNDAAQVRVYVRSTGCGDIPGLVEVIEAKLGNAFPRDLSNAVTLPRTVTTGGIPAGMTRYMSPDFVFARSEIGAASGSTVLFTAKIRWHDGVALRTTSWVTNVRLP
jgi:hypothetical protein